MSRPVSEDRPAERGEGPQRAGEPGVEDVVVAPDARVWSTLISVRRIADPADSRFRCAEVDRTSSGQRLRSRRRSARRRGRLLILSFGDVAVQSGPYQAGIRCPHHNWRLTHHGWMFSIQLKKVFSQLFGTISISPVAHRLRSAASASVSASTYHWSVSHGSITTPPRSPNGVAIVRGSIGSTPRLPCPSSHAGSGSRAPSAAHDQLARAVDAIAVEAVQAEEFVGHQPVGGLA